jgi:hypothetical protein
MKIIQEQTQPKNRKKDDGIFRRVIRFAQKPFIFLCMVIVIFVGSMLAGVYFYKAGVFSKIKTGFFDSANKIHSDVQLELSPYMDNGLDTLYLDIAFDDFQQISEKRDEALDVGVLISTDDDYVPGELHLEGQSSQKIELRLKGDWTDHLSGDKWSFRIHMKGDGQVYGMRTFSIQAPETREFLDEWAYHKFLLEHDIKTTHYYFVNVIINGEPKGIFALEESFAEELIESEKSRQGVLLRFNEDNMWLNSYTFWQNDVNIGGGLWVTDLSTAQVSLFREGTVLGDEVLSKEAQAAVALLEGFQQGNFSADEVFDVDLMGKFYAASDLWAALHGVAWHNIRFYYNPVTGLLEPVVYDGNALYATDTGNTLALSFTDEQLFADSNIRTAYAKHLLALTEEDVINNFISKNKDEFYRIQSALEKEYFELAGSDALQSPWSVLQDRSKMLRLQFDVEQPVSGTVTPLWSEDGDSYLEIKMRNEYLIPVELVSIQVNDQKYTLTADMINTDASSAFSLDVPNVMQLVPMKEWGGAAPLTGTLDLPYDFIDFAPSGNTISLTVKIAGTDLIKEIPLTIKESVDEPLSEFRPDTPSVEEALATHPYLQILDEDKLQMGIKIGEWSIRRDLILPKGYSLTINEGTTLKFAEDVILYSTGALNFKGTEEKPVILEPMNERWPGMVIIRADKQSVLAHTIIRDTASIERGGWILTGGITFYESPVKLDHVKIDGTFAEDSINVIRTTFDFNQAAFVDTASDAFDSDFSDGVFRDCFFENIGGDAVDISGSKTEVYDSSFTNIKDKSVSVGEHSSIIVQDVDINGTGLGIASKDLSDATLLRVNISGARNAALAAYQKKSVFGPASIYGEDVSISDCERISIIQIGSQAEVNGSLLPTVDETFDSLFNQGLLGS